MPLKILHLCKMHKLPLCGKFLYIGYQVFTYNFLQLIVIRSEDAVMYTKKFYFLSYLLLEVPTVTIVKVTNCS